MNHRKTPNFSLTNKNLDDMKHLFHLIMAFLQKENLNVYIEVYIVDIKLNISVSDEEN